MKKFIRQIFLLIICIITTGIGVSLIMKAALGIGAYDAAAVSISQVLRLKVGTVSMCANILCVGFQVIVSKKEFKTMQFLQIGIAILLGVVVNFLLYNILSQITVSVYVVKLVMFISGIIIGSFSVAIIMLIDIVSMPLEGVCLALSNKTNINFGRVRQYADVVLIALVLIFTLVFSTQLTLREGTILLMIIYGPLLDRFMKLFRTLLVKYDLI